MLGLKTTTGSRWLAQVDADLEEVLIDHAHCEKKAARTAMNLLCAYDRHRDLCREMETIVIEELAHFRLVLELLQRRGIAFRQLKPAGYGKNLNRLVRSVEPGRAVDRLLVAGLIEARSCERFSVLKDHIADTELATFYADLFESEARHHGTYLRLARTFAPLEDVDARLEWLAAQEAELIAKGEPLARMHS